MDLNAQPVAQHQRERQKDMRAAEDDDTNFALVGGALTTLVKRTLQSGSVVGDPVTNGTIVFDCITRATSSRSLQCATCRLVHSCYDPRFVAPPPVRRASTQRGTSRRTHCIHIQCGRADTSESYRSCQRSQQHHAPGGAHRTCSVPTVFRFRWYTHATCARRVDQTAVPRLVMELCRLNTN
jgi:hypothetical protein